MNFIELNSVNEAKHLTFGIWLSQQKERTDEIQQLIEYLKPMPYLVKDADGLINELGCFYEERSDCDYHYGDEEDYEAMRQIIYNAYNEYKQYVEHLAEDERY